MIKTHFFQLGVFLIFSILISVCFCCSNSNNTKVSKVIYETVDTTDIPCLKRKVVNKNDSFTKEDKLCECTYINNKDTLTVKATIIGTFVRYYLTTIIVHDNIKSIEEESYTDIPNPFPRINFKARDLKIQLTAHKLFFKIDAFSNLEYEGKSILVDYKGVVGCNNAKLAQ